MFRQTTTLAARLRTTSRVQRAVAQSTFNLEAVKARTFHWDPALKLTDLGPNTPRGHHKGDEEVDMSWMTTYSAFDPGFTRPVPPISSPPMSLFSLDETMGMMLQEKKAKDKGEKDGTTFSILNGTSNTSTTSKKSKRIGILQAILYGIPEPECFSYAREFVALGSLLHKIFYGVKEMDDGQEVIAFAKVTVPKKGEVGAKANAVENDTEVKIEVEERLDRHDGADMIAK